MNGVMVEGTGQGSGIGTEGEAPRRLLFQSGKLLLYFFFRTLEHRLFFGEPVDEFSGENRLPTSKKLHYVTP